MPLPPPTTEEVESVLARMTRQLLSVFESVEATWPEDGFEALQAEGAQLRLMRMPSLPKPGRNLKRVAVGQGFSLPADTQVHPNDREALARLCRCGARGPTAESRLSRREDGRYAYQTKRGVVLVLTAEQLVKRLLWLIPPARMHLVNFHGVFGPNAKERARVTPPSETIVETLGPTGEGPLKQRAGVKPKRPSLDWAMLQACTWGVDVWTCRCGGKRKVLGVVTSRRAAEEVLRNMGLLQPPAPVPVAQSPPQLELAV